MKQILYVSLIINIVFIGFITYMFTWGKNKKNPETHYTSKKFEFGDNQMIHVLININEGLIDYNDKHGSMSLAWKNGERNVIYKANKGEYSYLADKDGDGFLDIGVVRNSNNRVKFEHKLLPLK